MFAMFQCGRPDILPVGDLGVRKGFQTLYKLKVQGPIIRCLPCSCPDGVPWHVYSEQSTLASTQRTVYDPCMRMQALPNTEQMEAIAEKWRPYRSLGSYYMWRVAEGAPKTPKKSKSMPVGVTV